VIASNTLRSDQVALSLVNLQNQASQVRSAQQMAEGRAPGFSDEANRLYGLELEDNRTASALAQQDISVKLQQAVSLVGIAAQACANRRARAASAALIVLKLKEPGRVCGKGVSDSCVSLHS
jgi:hypothetical protein